MKKSSVKRSKGQILLSVVLAVAALAMGVAGAVGYVTRGTEQTAKNLSDMRVYAVMHAASGGIVDKIAKAAKDEAKEWATSKNEETGEDNIKGRDNQREYYNKAEADARAEAEKQYATFEGVDTAALESAIPGMEAAQKAYFDVETQARAVYAGVYTQAAALAEEQAVGWIGELESRALTLSMLTDARLAAVKAGYDALTDEEKAEYAEDFTQAAQAIAGKFGLTAPAEDAEPMEALLAVCKEGQAQLLAADAGDEALSEELQALTRDFAALAGAYWTEDAEKEERAAAFAEAAMAFAAEKYDPLTDDVKAGFEKAFARLFENAFAAATAVDAAAEAGAGEDEIDSDAVNVDYIGFVKSDEMKSLQDGVDAAYSDLWGVMMTILPSLTDDMKKDQQSAVETVVYNTDTSFEGRYQGYVAANALNALPDAQKKLMSLAGLANNLVLGAIAFLVLALTAFFYQALVKKLGVPRLIIGVFFIMLLILSGLYGLNMSSMMSNVLKRTGQYGILVLAMLPGIQCGISLNMGMTVGIVAGLLSTLIALENNMTGWPAFIFAVVVGVIFAAPIGWAYSKLLNRLKGNEMTVSTYVGFSFVSLMSIFWMMLPFKNPKLTWALGTGLRVMHTMSGNIGNLLNDFLAFKVLGVTVPTGLLLFLILSCYLLYLFSRSRTGTAMIAAGSNPRFAEAAGISVDRMRTIGTTLSTMVAAVGIIVYSQSFGFMQLYSGPRQMGFTAASAILIGGASTSRAKASHVLIGTFLFQGALSMGILVANQAISANGLSEVMRILISNGIILYALTQSGGEK